MIIILLL